MSMTSTTNPAAVAPATAAPTTYPARTGILRPEVLPIRVLGALLLVGALDPARWPHYLSPQWIFGLGALGVGFWAGAPVFGRPVIDSYRLRHRLARHRNTLLAAAAAFVAAFQSPPVWLAAVEVLLLLVYLALLDLGAAAPPPAGARLGQAGCAAAASALVLLAAVAPVTGGWWGRMVAAIAVLGTLGLLFTVLRLRRPAGYPRRASAGTGSAQAAARRH